MRRAVILASWLMLGAPASAQTYPFEGRWREGGNTCPSLLLTGTTMRYPGAGGGCQMTVGRQNATTFTYAAQCNDGSGRYSTSGTMQMSGPNRMLLRDRLMQGQVTTYDRC